MTVLPISDEPAVAWLPSSEVDPNARNVSLESLSGRLIMFRREDGPYLYDTTLAMFRREGLSAKENGGCAASGGRDETESFASESLRPVLRRQSGSIKQGMNTATAKGKLGGSKSRARRHAHPA
jgi:hypothetical protein